MNLQDRIQIVTKHIQAITDFKPEIGLVLGSGLGDYAEKIQDPIFISYEDIPEFLRSTVEGHVGRFVLGMCQGRKVIAMQGRFHGYEGYSQAELTIPIRVMYALGVRKLLLTNAAGGVNTNFDNGTLMVISDHINYSFQNPLTGSNLDDFGPRFPDMTDIYDKDLRKKLIMAAMKQDIYLDEGVYMIFSGPCYETPAEVRMARIVGADAVGMSTVPEAIVANHCGMQIIGISCITNMAAGVTKEKLNHLEVMETANRVKGEFTRVVDLVISDVF